MKKRFLTMIAVCLTLFVSLALAQGRGPRGEGSGQRTPPDPQQIAQHRVDRLAGALNLTDQQKSQALTIFTSAHQASQPLTQQLREVRKSLQEAVQTNNVAQVDSYATQIGTLTGQLLAIESKAEAQFRAILTDEQKAKLGAGRFGMMGGPGGPGRGPGGEGRGPGEGRGRGPR